VKAVDSALGAVDRWQRAHRVPAVAYAVVKKFGDDQANQYVVALGWYGFVAIYPLLLVVVTVLGFIGAPSLGHHLVSTLHQFPVVGSQFNPARAGSSLHGSTIGLVVGLAGLLYGAQGVTQTAQGAMADVWNVPRFDLPGFPARLVRSLAGLAIIGGAFVLNAALASVATAGGHGFLLRVPLLIGLVVVNGALYLLSFRVLTPVTLPFRDLVPGAALAGVGFTVLITLGSGLVQHQVRNSSATYGQFGVVIGLVAFLFLLAKITLYGAELNPVLHRRLWPRALQSSAPTVADEQVLRDISHQQQRRADQRIGVGFGRGAEQQAAKDARTPSPTPPSDRTTEEHPTDRSPSVR
jgi:uncharacterized BrkB/YihY/UPF0761 family membrane protein